MESCSKQSARFRPAKKIVGRPGDYGLQEPLWSGHGFTVYLTLGMAFFNNKQSGPEPSILGGLFVFLGIRTLVSYVSKSDQNPSLLLKIQAGQLAGLNLSFNPPTVHPQDQSGYAHKAVAHPMGVSRFCVLRLFWPHIRGRDGPS